MIHSYSKQSEIKLVFSTYSPLCGHAVPVPTTWMNWLPYLFEAIFSSTFSKKSKKKHSFRQFILIEANWLPYPKMLTTEKNSWGACKLAPTTLTVGKKVKQTKQKNLDTKGYSLYLTSRKQIFQKIKGPEKRRKTHPCGSFL